MKRILLAIALTSALPVMADEVFNDNGVNYLYLDGENSYDGVPGTRYEFINGQLVQIPNDHTPFCLVAANPDFKGNLVIPETVTHNGQAVKVRGIVKEAFKGNTEVTSVSFPTTFPQKNNLQTYYDGSAEGQMPFVGGSAFAGCVNLTKVAFADGMKKFCGGKDGYMFQDCPIAEADIPESLTEFDSFLEGSAVETIDIPEWVTVISFRECKKLKEVPALLGMTAIPQFCFMQCESLTNVVTPVNATSIAGSSFCLCSNLETLVISDNVEVVGIDAIRHNPKLKDVTIGAGVKKLGTACFQGCEAIENVTFLPTTPPGLENTGDPTTTEATARFFPETVYENALATVPDGSLAKYQAKPWFKFLRVVTPTTGIDDISADNNGARVEYYNLNGSRVADDTLVPGIYIKRQGSDTTKVFVK